MKTDQGAWEVQEQVEHAEEVLDPDTISSGLSKNLNKINNKFEHECLDAVVRLLNAHPTRQWSDDRVRGHKYSILGLPGTKIVAHQVWAIWFIVRRLVCNGDMPGALVADEMGLGMTFTLVAVVMLCKLVTEKVVMGLPLSILWENTLGGWVILVDNSFPGIVGEAWGWYLLKRLNSVPCRSVGDPDNNPSWVSSTYIGPWTNLGGQKARSCRDRQDCHRWDDTWNFFQPDQLVAHGKCESHRQGSEHQYWWAREPMAYPPRVVR